MKIVSVTFPPGNHTETINNGHVTKIEELDLPGPQGPMPYIRIHYSVGNGWWVDCPKHQLVAISYEDA